MEQRRLQDLDDTGTRDALFALSIASVAGTALFFAFMCTLWTPRLRGTIENLLDVTVRSFAGLQTICVLAYTIPGWTQESYDYLRTAEKWIWLDYFDGKIGDRVSDPSTTLPPLDLFGFSDHWTKFYFENCFTCVCFLTTSLIVSGTYMLLCKYMAKAKSWFPFHGLDVFVRTLQLVHFRLCLSLFIEIRMLQHGKSFDWSFGLAVGVSTVALIVLPIVQLMYLRLRQRGNLEDEGTMDLCGATYREFRPCWQVFHFHVCFIEHFALSIAICILGQWSDVQPYVVFAILLLSLVHAVATRPFRQFARNLEECMSRLLHALLGLLIIIVYNKGTISLDEDGQSFVTFLLVLLWLVCKLICEAYFILCSIRAVRTLVTADPPETKKLGSEKTLGSILKTAASEESPGSKRRSKKTSSLSPDVTANEEASARTDFIEVSTTPKESKDEKEEIDPRLDRKTAVRRRRKKKVSIPG